MHLENLWCSKYLSTHIFLGVRLGLSDTQNPLDSKLMSPIFLKPWLGVYPHLHTQLWVKGIFKDFIVILPLGYIWIGHQKPSKTHQRLGVVHHQHMDWSNESQENNGIMGYIYNYIYNDIYIMIYDHDLTGFWWVLIRCLHGFDGIIWDHMG